MKSPKRFYRITHMPLVDKRKEKGEEPGIDCLKDTPLFAFAGFDCRVACSGAVSSTSAATPTVTIANTKTTAALTTPTLPAGPCLVVEGPGKGPHTLENLI